MNKHRHRSEVLEKKRTKRVTRKEVRYICKEITEDPDIIYQDDFQLSHLGWELKTAN